MVFVSLPMTAQDSLNRKDEMLLEEKNLEGIILRAQLLGADINSRDPETGDSILRQIVNGEIDTAPYAQRGYLSSYVPVMIYAVVAFGSLVWGGLMEEDKRSEARALEGLLSRLGLRSEDAKEVASMGELIATLSFHGFDPLFELNDGRTQLEAVFEDASISRELRVKFILALVLAFSEQNFDFNTPLDNEKTVAEFLLANLGPELVHNRPEETIGIIEDAFKGN